MERILNSYIKIEPVIFEGFMAQQKETYEEMGIVVGRDEYHGEIPIGAKVYFDSWMAKKYPVEGDPTKFQWFVKFEDIVKYDAPE